MVSIPRDAHFHSVWDTFSLLRGLCWKFSIIIIIPNGKKCMLNPYKSRGLNQPTWTWKEGVRIVKPSCNYHFWCLKQSKNINLGGLSKKFLKKLRSKIFFLQPNKSEFFSKSNFHEKIISNCAFSSQIWI